MLFHYQILLGSILVLITTAVHGVCTAVVIAHLRRRAAKHGPLQSFSRRLLLVSLVVLMLFLAALLEASIWAATYLAAGAISGVEAALYFSLVTFTTLGYGDIVPVSGAARVFAGFEAIVGQLYVAIIVARLVAMQIGQSSAEPE